MNPKLKTTSSFCGAAVFAALFLFAGVMLAIQYADKKQSAEAFYEIAALIQEESKQPEASEETTEKEGNPAAETTLTAHEKYSQFQRLWKYVTVRSTKERTCYKVINGQRIKYTKKPALGTHQKNNPSIVYTMDFEVTPHQLRHTYITNLLYAGVDPKTVQYLAGHENSKTTMDIYAKVKYNRPEELIGVVNRALT